MTMVVGVGGGAGNIFYLFASCRIWYDDVLQVVRQPKSDRSNEMTLRTMHELCLNMSIAIGADTITCNLASVIDGRTRGSVYGSSVVYHVMGGVLISNDAVSYFQRALNSGVVQNVTNLRSGHKSHQCALV